MFQIIENELSNVTEKDLFIVNIGSLNMGNNTRKKLTQYNYQKLINASDIYTLKIINRQIRFGFSKEQNIYFIYYYNNDRVWVYLDYDYFIKSIVKSFGGSDLSGCTCDDCVQIKLDVYTFKHKLNTITVNDLKNQIKNLIN